MFFLKEMVRYLRGGFKDSWAFVAAVILLSILDPTTFSSIAWYFLFRGLLPLQPATLTMLAQIYLVVATVMALISLLGRRSAVRTVTLFYISVGLFFLLNGWFGMSGREFAAWPWVLVWVATLGVTVSQFSREYEVGENKTPQA